MYGDDNIGGVNVFFSSIIFGMPRLLCACWTVLQNSRLARLTRGHLQYHSVFALVAASTLRVGYCVEARV